MKWNQSIFIPNHDYSDTTTGFCFTNYAWPMIMNYWIAGTVCTVGTACKFQSWVSSRWSLTVHPPHGWSLLHIMMSVSRFPVWSRAGTASSTSRSRVAWSKSVDRTGAVSSASSNRWTWDQTWPSFREVVCIIRRNWSPGTVGIVVACRDPSRGCVVVCVFPSSDLTYPVPSNLSVHHSVQHKYEDSLNFYGWAHVSSILVARADLFLAYSH